MAKTKEEMAEYQRSWYAANRDKRTEYRKAWVAARPGYMAEAMRRHIAKDPEGFRAKAKVVADAREAKSPGRRRNTFLKNRYGITLEQYQDMWLAQNGKCAICGKSEMGKNTSGTPNSMNVDHCHTTGRVRGLLCNACNTSIGKMGEDPTRLRAAAMYLESDSHGT